MFLKSIFAVGCLIAAVSASPVLIDYNKEAIQAYSEEPMPIIRHARSPGDGSVQIDYTADKTGRTAGVQYNQNLYKSDDGRFTVDAYARGSRNFDYNRNDYGGGVQGSYRFGKH